MPVILFPFHGSAPTPSKSSLRSQRAMLFPGPTHWQPLADNGTLEKPGLLRVSSIAALVNVNSRKSCSVTNRFSTISNASGITSRKSGTSKYVKSQCVSGLECLHDIQLSTTRENERRLWSNVKSSRFLVYKVAPRERALSASKQSFTNVGSLLLRFGLECNISAKMAPASFQWL